MLTFILILLPNWLPDSLSDVGEPVTDLLGVKARFLAQLHSILLLKVGILGMLDEPLF